MYSKTVTTIYSSIVNWFDKRSAERQKKHAMTVPRGMLFQPDGWGPVNKTELPLRHYKAESYPAPNYAIFSKAKDRPAYSKAGKQMCDIARIHWAQGNTAKAEESYSQAIEACPENPEFMFEQAQLLWSEKKCDQAKSLLEKALRLKPDFVSARVSYFHLCMEQGDFKTPRENWMDIVRYKDREQVAGVQKALHDMLKPTL